MDDKRRRRISVRVGQAIEQARTRAGLTQEEVAERLGIGPEGVSRIERGVVHASAWRLVELAEILGCRVASLLSEASDASIDQQDALHAILEGLAPDDRAHVIAIAGQTAAHLRRRVGPTRRRS